MAVAMKNREGEKILIQTVKDLVENANPRMTFCLAAATSFVFIGTAEEFKRDMDLLDRHFCSALFQDEYIPLMNRKITGYHKRDVPGETAHMFYIEGKDRGIFWLRCEYEDFIKKCRKRSSHKDQ